MALQAESKQQNGSAASEEFVTVVSVQPTPVVADSFVTVLSIGSSSNATTACIASEFVDPAHPEEVVDVYRLPGERLGFGLKFDGGNKNSERVRRLFIQSCAEQSPASRAKCSWGHLGEGDEVLAIDNVPVTQMTRLDCVGRLKESQLVIKLAVRCRGALRPEVVSAERKLSGQQQQQQQQESPRNKVPPELPAAPPPVPPRKLRHAAQANRGLADGEASPGAKHTWDSTKSTTSPLQGSPHSQGSYRSATSSARSSSYDSCNSSPAKVCLGVKNDSPKDSPKVHVSPVLNKGKQESPAEAQSYLDARSQDGSSTHGSTSDDTSSSLSTVVDRFSTSDRFSTTSTISTASDHLEAGDAASGCDSLLSNGLADLSNPDFLLTRLANSEARTYVESRGDVERVTAVVAPNTVLIEETPALQPPLSFQDAPLSYGHEPRPGIFYSADLAADSRTHFRPIRDDAEVVEKVNGEAVAKVAPPLPVRNHVNRIPVNQADEGKVVLPPKPMPRKDVKAKRKRPPPPPPPPRREPQQPVPEARILDGNRNDVKREAQASAAVECNGNLVAKENYENVSIRRTVEKGVDTSEKEAASGKDENANKRIEDVEPTNKVLEIVGMKKVKIQKSLSKASDDGEVSDRRADDSVNDEKTSGELDVELKNSINRKLLDMKDTGTISIELEEDSENDNNVASSKEDDARGSANEFVEIPLNDVDDETEKCEESETTTNDFDEDDVEMKEQDVDDIMELSEKIEQNTRKMQEIRDSDKCNDEDDVTDESDGDDYYWQSNLATIGEEEETNSLEYENA